MDNKGNHLTRREFLRGMGATILSIPLTGLSEKVFAGSSDAGSGEPMMIKTATELYSILTRMKDVENFSLKGGVKEEDISHINGEFNQTYTQEFEYFQDGLRLIKYADYKNEKDKQELNIFYMIFKNNESSLKLSLLMTLHLMERYNGLCEGFNFFKKKECLIFITNKLGFLKTQIRQKYEQELNKQGIVYLMFEPRYNKKIRGYFSPFSEDVDSIKNIDIGLEKIIQERRKPAIELFEN